MNTRAEPRSYLDHLRGGGRPESDVASQSDIAADADLPGRDHRRSRGHCADVTSTRSRILRLGPGPEPGQEGSSVDRARIKTTRRQGRPGKELEPRGAGRPKATPGTRREHPGLLVYGGAVKEALVHRGDGEAGGRAAIGSVDPVLGGRSTLDEVLSWFAGHPAVLAQILAYREGVRG